MEIRESSIWEALKEEKLPIVLYGTGNGAEKIINNAKAKGILISAVFSSDGFSKNKTFLGYPVLSLSEIEEEFPKFIMLLGFAAGNEELISYVKEIGKRSEKFFVPEVPVFGEDIFSKEVFESNRSQIEELYEMLADEQSKRVLKNLIEYKLSGKPEYLYEIETDRSEVFQNIFRFNDSEIYLDLGAFNGDTVEEFLQETCGKYKKIIAVEPAPKNFERLRKFSFDRKLENIELINAAISDKSGEGFFSEKGGRNPFLSDSGKYSVKTIRLDEIACNPTYLKIDVEGMDFEALVSGEEMIKKAKPKIALSLYHKTLDFIKLPLYLKSLVPEYKLYLRHHPYLPAWETNLYAKL